LKKRKGREGREEMGVRGEMTKRKLTAARESEVQRSMAGPSRKGGRKRIFRMRKEQPGHREVEVGPKKRVR